jgi:hypothetical protein
VTTWILKPGHISIINLPVTRNKREASRELRTCRYGSSWLLFIISRSQHYYFPCLFYQVLSISHQLHLTCDDARQFHSRYIFARSCTGTTSESSRAQSPKAADMFWLVVLAWNTSVLFRAAADASSI